MSQKIGKTVWIRGLHLQFADGKTWGQSFCGGKSSHVKKKTLWRRHPSTKDCSLCGGAGNAVPPAATLWVWASVSHGQLIGTSCPVHWLTDWVLGRKANSIWKVLGKLIYAAKGQNKQKVKGACGSSMFTKHWAESSIPFHKGTQVTATATLQFNSYLLLCYFPADSSVLQIPNFVCK